MKPTISILVLFLFQFNNAQVQPPEAYISFGGFFEEQFDPNSYFNFSVGTEPFAYKFIAPEVDVTYYFGGQENEDFDFDGNGEATFHSILSRDFSSWVWGVGPKFFLQDDYNRVVLISKYHFGNQKAVGHYLDSNGLELRQEHKVKFNFWSFSLGYEFLGADRVGKIGLYITYTGFNAGKSLNRLDFSENGYPLGNFNSKAIGLTVRISTGFKKRHI